ncbi:MAG TPA: hypothetical protein VGC76_02020 [Pyrinomonadaceae bacterium]|jgi:hypothetical protein
MKRLRIFLMMFALGLASVSFFNSIYDKWTEIPVELPQVKSETPIIIFPRYFNEIPGGGGGASGCDCGSPEFDQTSKQRRKVNKHKFSPRN